MFELTPDKFFILAVATIMSIWNIVRLIWLMIGFLKLKSYNNFWMTFGLLLVSLLPYVYGAYILFVEDIKVKVFFLD